MSSLRISKDGEIEATFTTQECQVLINLTEQLLELLGESAIHYKMDANIEDSLMNLMGISGNDAPPDDPVLRRLLPDAYEEKEEAAEFRRYTEAGLREKKRAHALLIHETIIRSDEESESSSQFEDSIAVKDDEVRLAVSIIKIRREDSDAWLSGLNDLRLALAVRLGISDEFGKAAKTNLNDGDNGNKESSTARFDLMLDSDPMKPVYAVYSWLGWLQQSLLEVLINSGDEHQAS
jgi:hypothetical protein